MTTRFTDNGDNTVTDFTTGLTWMKEDDGKERTWTDAIAYCEKNQANLPGSGWRLPTGEELFTLVDFTKYDPAIEPIFSHTKSDWYWSSTPCADSADGAWLVDFYNGGVGWGGMDSGSYVRPVRQTPDLLPS